MHLFTKFRPEADPRAQDDPNPGPLDLHGTHIHHHMLDHADLVGANMSRARIRHLDLSGRDLSNAHLQGLWAERVRFRDATLVDADLSWANLCGADLRNADLTRCLLTETDLTRADLRGAHLGKALNLELAHLRGAVADQCTSWPAQFSARDAGVFVDQS